MTETTRRFSDLYDLPPTIPAGMADEILNIGQTLGKRLRAQGRYPLRILPGIGRHQKVSTADLLAYLSMPIPRQRVSGPDGMSDSGSKA